LHTLTHRRFPNEANRNLTSRRQKARKPETFPVLIPGSELKRSSGVREFKRAGGIRQMFSPLEVALTFLHFTGKKAEEEREATRIDTLRVFGVQFEFLVWRASVFVFAEQFYGNFEEFFGLEIYVDGKEEFWGYVGEEDGF
jgi:hypothetical protein